MIGTRNEHAFRLLSQVCQGVSQDAEPVSIIRTSDSSSSELGKLMCNAMLAQRISAINSITALCEQTSGCDIREVKAIVASESRIGGQYLQCSLGFGGSCFEKDLQSLIYILSSQGH